MTDDGTRVPPPRTDGVVMVVGCVVALTPLPLAILLGATGSSTEGIGGGQQLGLRHVRAAQRHAVDGAPEAAAIPPD